MATASIVHALLAFGCAPLIPGIVNRTKAIAAGRVGQPLLQPYFDVLKLLRKSAVYSRTTSAVFRAGPVVGLAALAVATLLVPFGGAAAVLAFPADFVLFAYLFGVARFARVLAALDTGSSFEGMGASREVTFAALAEPALLLGLAAMACHTGSVSLSPMYAGLGPAAWARAAAGFAPLAGALLVVFLAENARVPIDDPTTHLELTMIHEVLVLDHSGPDLALIEYGSALQLWLLGALVVGLVVPVRTGSQWIDGGAAVAGMLALAIVTGVIESSMARLRLLRVPQLLIGASVLSTVALVLLLR
jgi:formate hydrogenlyase subunit 4